MYARHALLAIALVFGVWETTDIPDTGAPALVFAVLFLSCAVWLWRRRGLAAAALIAFGCAVEASQAHTWKNASAFEKLAAEVLGTAGLLAAASLAGIAFARRLSEGRAGSAAGRASRQATDPGSR